MKDVIALRSWNDVEQALGEIAVLEAKKNKIVSGKKATISKLKAEIDEETNDLDFEINQHTQNVIIYVKAHLDEMWTGGKKSMTFSTGKVLTRTSEKFIYPDDEDLILSIEDLKMATDFLEYEAKILKSVLKARIKKDVDLMDSLGIIKEEETEIIIKTG